MSDSVLIEEILHAWRVNNGINLLLIPSIPASGFFVIPPNSRGRTVGEQFAHIRKARSTHLKFNRVTPPLKLPRLPKGGSPTRAQLRFRATGEAIEALLEDRLRTGGRVQYFQGRPIRCFACLIAHDSHHRGQILLALKQNGMRLPDRVAMNGVWGKWYWSKPVT